MNSNHINITAIECTNPANLPFFAASVRRECPQKAFIFAHEIKDFTFENNAKLTKRHLRQIDQYYINLKHLFIPRNVTLNGRPIKNKNQVQQYLPKRTIAGIDIVIEKQKSWMQTVTESIKSAYERWSKVPNEWPKEHAERYAIQTAEERLIMRGEMIAAKW